MIADDLFAGAGGWDLAARELGIHARGVENMKEARATRDAAGLTTIHDDVWTYVPDGKATGFIASPPCQTFSAAGKGSGRKALDDVLRLIDKDVPLYRSLLKSMGAELGDDRTALVLTPLHYALRGDYEWLAWEQVPTVLPVWEACAERLRLEGWNVWTGLLHAEQYGVPQTRKRAFLLASRTGTAAPPEPTHSRYYVRDWQRVDSGTSPWISMASALGWGLLDRYIGKPDWVFRSPSPTVAADPRLAPRGCKHPRVGCCSQWGGTPGLQFGPGTVRITPQEAGVLQSFPANFSWQGNKGKQFLQAGNAIPPLLALAVLSAVVPGAAEVVA